MLKSHSEIDEATPRKKASTASFKGPWPFLHSRVFSTLTPGENQATNTGKK